MKTRISRRVLRGIACAFCASVPWPATALAQETLLPSTSWGLAPIASAWVFMTPIAQSSGAVRGVAQVAVPFRVSAQLGDRWTLDFSGAASKSTLLLDNKSGNGGGLGGGGSGSGNGGGGLTQLDLTGLTDVKLRLSTSIGSGGGLLLTGGLNVPTGTTGLSADQTFVLQAIGAPALHFPVNSLGIGPGATLGFAAARESGDWALAFGASVEERAEYTPIEIALATGTSATKVTPGAALHVTAGADGPAGEDRISFLLVADAYTKDQLTQGGGPTASTTSYKLGPQVTALARLDVAGQKWREANYNLSVRYRSEFSDATGTSVAGSSGSYLEASFAGVRGGPTGKGFVFGLDGRYHSGLTFTDALVGAAVSAAGITLGTEIPAGATMFRFAVHMQYGQFDTGTTKTTGAGLQLIGAFAARREAR
jgi:hypothetical protein